MTTPADSASEPGDENESLRLKNERLEGLVADRSAVAERRAEALRRLAVELSETEAKERAQLANVLHDDLQQLIVGAMLHLPALLELPPDQQKQGIAKIEEMLRDCLDLSRDVSMELSPPVLKCGTLPEALQWLGARFANRYDLKVTVAAVDSLPPLPEHLRFLIFQAVKELLLNVLKHSGERKAAVRLSGAGEPLKIEVEDQGVGFSAGAVEAALQGAGRLGLFNIRERLEAISGRLEFERTPQGGACFRLIVPLRDESTSPASRGDDAPSTTERQLRDVNEALLVSSIRQHELIEQAQDALEYAENIIETVREPMLVLDDELRVRTANNSFYRTFRVIEGQTEGQLLSDLGNGQWDIPALRKLLEDILHQQSSFNDYEVTHEFESIGRRVMLLNARRVQRDRQDTGLILLAIEDITERRRLEVERRELETRFTSLVKNIRDHSIFTLDINGRITSWNIEAERILGYSESDAIGQHFSIIFTPEDRQAGIPGQELATAIDEGRAEDERWHLRKNGERFWALGIVTRTQDAAGSHTGYSKILRDMTDRKRAEERVASELATTTRLHALSTRLLSAADLPTALQDVLENAIESCGADFGNIQLFNPQAKALEIIAQRGFRDDFLDYFRMVRVDDGAACAQAMQSGERIIIEDVQTDTAFEPHRPIAAAAGYRAVQSTPLKAHDGTIVGMLSTHYRTPHPPSDRDQQLLDLYARHAADLIHRSRLEQALKDTDHRKDEFLATLAHELRNPLAPLRNAVELLKRADDNTELIEQTRRMMERQVGQMVRLVDDLLDISRITRGKLQLCKKRVSLADILNIALETARPLIDASTQTLTVTLPSQPVYVQADPIRLTQVFANLLNNAAKYTENAGHIWLTAERQDSEAVVSVRDNGIGLAAEHLPHVFTMFSQVTSALERSQGGLGIGLSLVKGLVELHGGTIEAHSDGPDKGSEFIVHLPIVVSQVDEPQTPNADSEQVPIAKCRILVVDDLRDSADSMAMMLKEMGHDTRTAYDGLEAVRSAAVFQPSVVLLDIGLPKMNGYEAARRIRSEPWGGNVALVALTGWGQDEDRRRSREAGFDYHLTKPVELAALEKLLAAVQPVKS